MKYVLFTAVGETDPIRGQSDGPMLHIVRHYKPEKVYLFLTADMSKKEKDTNCYEDSIKFVHPKCKVEKIHTDIVRAHCFDEFAVLFDSIINRIHAENPMHRILLNVSSATPQIKPACAEVVSHRLELFPFKWILLERRTAGIYRISTLIKII